MLQLARFLSLSYLLDKLRYHYEKIRLSKKNKKFIEQNPRIKLPPHYLVYESFKMDFDKYYYGGRKTAQWLIQLISKYTELNHSKILDWGCGPGRVVRHLPGLLESNSIVYGCDYNKESINWCRNNVEKVNFHHNQLSAVLPYPDNEFNAVYGISIITHLSEKRHYEWVKELYRVLKPGGILLLTSHGNNFKIKLDKNELSLFNSGKIVVRESKKEGHRSYAAFHPELFMRTLFKNFSILEHIEVKTDGKSYIPQDVWILRK